MDRYGIIRRQLEKLGYKHCLLPESLPLTETLVNELLALKEELKIYKQMMKDLEKEKRNLEKSLEPYRQDNARLLEENNNLHGKLLKREREHEKELKDFKKKIRKAESELTDSEFINNYYLQKVNGLEKEVLERNKKLLDLLSDNIVVVNTEGKTDPIELPVLEISERIKVKRENLENNLWKARAQANDIKIVNMVEAMEKRASELLEELEELRLDNQHQYDIITALKCQLSQKDREIERLRRALEGGRPMSALSRDCCCQCVQKDNKIKSLEEQLDEAVEKQHEAMSRALQLAERNQHLEREFKDIDNMALAVEEECQNKVKQNLKNMNILQDKLRQKIEEVRKLEGTVLDMKNTIERNGLELEDLRKEKHILEKHLSVATNEKKNLNDKINQFLLNEKHLNSEISRLQEINKSLQRQISDMEERVMDILGTDCKGNLRGRQKKPSSTSGIANCKTHFSQSSMGPMKCSKGEKICKEDHNFQECFHMTSSVNLLEKIQQERDFYHDECHRLKEQLGSLPCRSDSSIDVMRQLKDRDREMADLKQEVFMLKRENYSLLKRLECSESFSNSSGDSIKIILDRLEKERDMALSDISRLQGERDALRERIKLATESQKGEQSRLERIVMENEERIRRLESERRELISSQSSQRIALGNLEEKCDEYKEQARNAQTELSQMTANYNQLKTLQEQTDRSLSDVQGRLTQTELELRVSATKIKDLEKANMDLENEITVLKREKSSLKSSLTLMEKEKDGLLITLDEKTEKVAKLEAQIKKQDIYIAELKEANSHLEKKFDFTLNEKTNREHNVRALERALEHLKEELQNCERQKEAFIRENRRLQDDIASAAKDCVTARRELDSEKQEVENLKRQLQQYVSEVKRAEELLTKKESERNQMLDHFRSLSLEATALESNNHTLESTVENTKTQLIAANNRIMDLEHQIATKDTLLYNYEKQIAELTTQIAELETKLKQQTDLRIQAEDDLNALRDLCSTIDGQKEALRRQASSYDAEKIQLMNEVRRLNEEYEGLNEKLNHERSLSQTLEKSLSNSRQETLEHKITNKDLQSQVEYLRQKVEDLTQKLDSESQDVRRYQAQCADLSQQVSELRREVTNARFEKAKALEDSRRNFQEDFQCDEDVKEISFDCKDQNESSRNIPPLTFPEDSDRTVSLESEENYSKTQFDEAGNTFRKSFWKLSPLMEKFEEKTESKSNNGLCRCVDTTSELSSLPDDSESRNGVCNKIDLSTSEDKATTDFTPYPTYSVDRRFETENRCWLNEKTELGEEEEVSNFCGNEPKAPSPLGGFDEAENLCGNYLPIRFTTEELFEDNEPCSECEFQKSLWDESQLLPDDGQDDCCEISLPETLSPKHSHPICLSRRMSLDEDDDFRTCLDECVGGDFKSEIDDNTFSVHTNRNM